MSEKFSPVGWVLYELKKNPQLWDWFPRDDGAPAYDAISLQHLSGFSVVFENPAYPLLITMSPDMQPEECSGKLTWRRVWFTYGRKDRLKVKRSAKKYLSDYGLCPHCKAPSIKQGGKS